MIDKNASAALKVLLHPVPRPMWLRAWRLDEERWGWLAWAGLAAELIDVMLVLNAKQRTRLAACRPGAGTHTHNLVLYLAHETHTRVGRSTARTIRA